MLGRVARNTLANWLGGASAAVIAFFLTPFVIDRLKDAEFENQAYGVWTFIVAATGYLVLADLGITQGVLQYFTRYRANQEFAVASNVVSAGLAILLATSAAALAVAGIISIFVPKMVSQVGLDENEIRFAFLVSALAVILRVLLAPYNAVIIGKESFHILNAILVTSRLILAGSTVLALSNGLGLAGLAMAVLVSSVVETLAKVYMARRLVPGLPVWIRSFSRDLGKQIVSYGAWLFGHQASVNLLTRIDLLIVPILYGAEATAVYGIAVTLISYAQLPLGGFAAVLIPTAISADARGSTSETRSVLMTGTRFGLSLAVVFFVGFWFWGEEFIYLWLDDSTFLWDAKNVSAATILSIASIDRVLFWGLTGPQQVLIGMRRVRILSAVGLSQAVVGLALALWLQHQIGLIGIPVGIAAAGVLGRLVVTLYSCRLSDVSLAEFTKNAVLRPLIAMIMLAISCVLIKELIPQGGWGALMLGIAATLLASLLWGALICVTSPERRFLWSALGRFRSRPES